MPAPRLRKHTRRAGWSLRHIATLLHGLDPYCAFIDGEPRVVPARCRQGWDAPGTPAETRLKQAVADLGDELLAEWIAERPGTRPWFWWRFLAPAEKRQRIRSADPETPLHLRANPPLGIAPEPWPVVIVDTDFESQRDYLARLDLLTAAEKGTINATPKTSPSHAPRRLD